MRFGMADPRNYDSVELAQLELVRSPVRAWKWTSFQPRPDHVGKRGPGARAVGSIVRQSRSGAISPAASPFCSGRAGVRRLDRLARSRRPGPAGSGRALRYRTSASQAGRSCEFTRRLMIKLSYGKSGIRSGPRDRRQTRTNQCVSRYVHVSKCTLWRSCTGAGISPLRGVLWALWICLGPDRRDTRLDRTGYFWIPGISKRGLGRIPAPRLELS